MTRGSSLSVELVPESADVRAAPVSRCRPITVGMFHCRYIPGVGMYQVLRADATVLLAMLITRQLEDSHVVAKKLIDLFLSLHIWAR